MGDARPLIASAAVFIAGVLVLAMTLSPEPLGLKDIDGDGISDLYQDVTVLKDLQMTSDGEWVELEVGRASEMDLPFLIFVGVLLLIALPAAVLLYISRGPLRKAERDERDRASVMQDNVRRVAAFLEINPSLLSALKCAHISQSEKEGRILGRVLWEVRCRGRTFDECMAELSEEWGKEEPMLGRAIESLRKAELEPSEEEVLASARRVVERLSEESRERMEAYGRSLSAPSTALFGLGVLLPVLLATMVPIAGIGGRTTYMVGFLLWAVLPASILVFGGYLVRKRPRFSPAHKGQARSGPCPTPLNIASTLLGLVLMVLSIRYMLTGVSPLTLPLAGLSSLETHFLMLLCGTALASGGVIDIYSRGPERERRRDELLGRSVPELLNGIGSSLLDGRSFEAALKRASVKGDGRVRTELAKAFPVPGMSGQVTQSGGLDKALMSAREFSRAGLESGGRAVRALSRHLGELQRLDREMRERIKASIGQMEVTSSIFAPLMIGSSAGIFKLMEGSSSALEGGSLMLSSGSSPMGSSTFILLSGVYLLLLSVVTALTFHRLEQGAETGGWSRVPRRLVQSGFAFTAGVVLSSLLLGG